MSTFKIICFWFLVIVGIYFVEGGQTCLSCIHVVQPRDCFKLTECGDHEQCYLKRYVTSAGKVWFDVGCLDNSKCTAITGGPIPGGNSFTMPPSIIGRRRQTYNETYMKQWTHPPSVIGRRQTNFGDQTVCEHCCNGTLCNSGGYCGASPFGNPGPVCYSCKEAPTADGCDQITQCGVDEKCFIGQVLNQVSQEFRWTHGCKSNLTCAGSSKRQTDLDYDDGPTNKVCDDCCENDICNNVCTNYIDWNAPVLPNTTVIDNPVTTDYPTTEVSRTTATWTALGIISTEKVTTRMQQTDKSTEKSTFTTPPEQTTTQRIQQTTSATTSTTSDRTTASTTTSTSTTAPTTEATTTITKGTTLDPFQMVDCNFEAGVCNWHQDPTDDGDWRIHSGSTATANTGPMHDHTYGTGKGHYIYLEASDLNYEDIVRLESSPIVWQGQTCLSFWYHMHGHYIASLTIYVKNSHGNSQKLWSQSQDHGTNWLHAKINLPNTPGKIVIEGYRGADIHGDIALDDIKLVPNCHV